VKREDEPLSDRHLDELLSSLPTPEPSAALRRAVAEIPLRHPQRAPWFFGPAPAWLPFRSLAAAALVAVAVLALGALAGLYGDDELVAGSADRASDGATAGAGADAGETERVDEIGELATLAFADDLDTELEP
jgi:hypothetical protein